jgi:hypothetical protein
MLEFMENFLKGTNGQEKQNGSYNLRKHPNKTITSTIHENSKLIECALLRQASRKVSSWPNLSQFLCVV